MRRPLVIYDFATAPFWISFYRRKIWFSSLSVQFLIVRCFLLPVDNRKTIQWLILKKRDIFLLRILSVRVGGVTPALSPSWSARSVLPTLDEPTEKFRSLRKYSGHLLNLTLWRYLGRWKFCYLCLRAWEKCDIYLIYTKLERIRGEKQIFKKFAHFRPFLCKIGQNLTAALSYRSTFFRPFLSYVAELSASWQHCARWGRSARCRRGRLSVYQRSVPPNVIQVTHFLFAGEIKLLSFRDPTGTAVH